MCFGPDRATHSKLGAHVRDHFLDPATGTRPAYRTYSYWEADSPQQIVVLEMNLIDNEAGFRV